MGDTILEGLNFSNFIRNGPIIMYIYNQDFQYVWTNTAFQEYTGYANEDVLHKKFWEQVAHCSICKSSLWFFLM